MYDTGHFIYNNYVETSKALQIGPAGPIHAADKDATVVFNTFIGPVKWSGDVGTTFSNNVVAGAVTGGASPGATYQGNIVSGGAAGAMGYTMADPKLVRMGDVLVPTAMSPTIGAAAGSFPFVTDDIAGHPRTKADVGAQQFSGARPSRGVLTTADVGPDAP
jgi:poly(beta-D-mannuronate) lyase